MATEQAVGNCYEASFGFVCPLLADGPRDALLCHGTVVGTAGPNEGKQFGHAWVEVDEFCLDVANGRRMVIPRSVYYEVGQITDVYRYDAHEARVQALRTGHYGPWHESSPG